MRGRLLHGLPAKLSGGRRALVSALSARDWRDGPGASVTGAAGREEEEKEKEEQVARGEGMGGGGGESFPSPNARDARTSSTGEGDRPTVARGAPIARGGDANRTG